ncbi:MAG: SRPBCC family protein [Acidimicrobiales bacterium]
MFRRQIAFPVGVDRLWELLTDPSSVATWFGSTVEWELAPGAEIRFADGEDGDRTGRVESVTPPRQLRFQWWPDERGAEISEVTYHLESIEDGTQLTITEEPLRSQPIPAVDSVVRSGSATNGTEGAYAAPSQLASRDESMEWSRWDTRLAGAWCMATAPALLVTS